MHTEKQEMALHQLKNKLANIQALAQLAIDERDARNELHVGSLDFLQEIVAISRDTFPLLLEMLETKRLERGLALQREPSDVTAVAHKIVAANQGQAKIKEISLVLTTLMPCYARIDRYLLGEAIDNLVSNAIRYSPPGTSVWVSVHIDRSAHVCIEVRDEGHGFTEEENKRLFSRYRSFSSRSPNSTSSTGLGLAIAKHIVELHGGTLTAGSKGPTQGSVFSIRMPTLVLTPRTRKLVLTHLTYT